MTVKSLPNDRRLPQIAHISLVMEHSVDRKLLAQARSALNEELPIDFYAVGASDELGAPGNTHVVPSPYQRWRQLPAYRRFSLLCGRFDFLESAIPLHKYDAIVLRYPKLPVFSDKFTKRFGDRLITEHHTNEIGEIRATYPRTGKALSFAESLIGARFLKKSRAVVAITDDLRCFESARSGGKPSQTIGNGAAVRETPFLGYTRAGTDEVTLIFIASHLAPWHGIDRLISGLAKHREAPRVTLKVVARIREQEKQAFRTQLRKHNANADVIFRPPDYTLAITTHFRGATIAVSSLGLHRNGMKEGSPLKTREYLALGFPILHAHRDPDIPDDAPFVLQAPPDETPIDIARVTEFARRLSEDDYLGEDIRRFAEDNLDWSTKLRRLYAFACQMSISDPPDATAG